MGKPYFDRIPAHYSRELDRDLWALDLTSDFGIPAFVAVSQARSGRPRVLTGFGAHLLVMHALSTVTHFWPRPNQPLSAQFGHHPALP